MIARKYTLAYLFLLPAVALLAAFYIYPVLTSVVRSFTDWNGFDAGFLWVGWGNYKNVFGDHHFWAATGRTLRFAFVTTIVQTILGFLLAFFIYTLVSDRWRKLMRVAVYIPVILPGAVVSLLWSNLLSPNFGLVNEVLRAIGLETWARGWLGSTETAMNTLMIVNTWKFIGMTITFYIVAMLAIPKDLIESAKMDGAGSGTLLWHIFRPLLKGITEVNFILSLIGGLKAFDLIYMMTGGGPGDSTTVLGIMIYRRAFLSFRFGEAITMGIILFIVILTLTLISRRLIAAREDEQ
ncbi:carbohydrate ABC transporter permease [Paenibacillus sp. PAMC21692]|uniref:carbohydrate ABC transporter permease n=1 Tax=Paenibacillus sp. PAMC21692 TaxID=2762320 RepID=UPI00164D70CB|nr:sugar ABC transporter permease [Paenibacillus sp. PAMC21692]QNK56539.1 sugar ABC transporter permease [Paenibacillus sp. PAMC21692]